MKKRIAISMFVILFVAAAMGGATMAWFTDEAETTNQFTAGTLEIDAEDEWENYVGEDWTNANPGDCEPKDFTVSNEGSKNMYVRFSFEGEWIEVPNPREVDGFNIDDADDGLVEIKPEDGDLDDWTELNGYWYYNGLLGEGEEIEFTFLVCLDGPDTGNEYQDATYEITFTFEAIQATHDASFDKWGAGYYEDEPEGWYEVTYDSNNEEYNMTPDEDELTWEPTGSGEPNYKGWPND